MPRISELRVNGVRVHVDAEAERSLLSILRDDLDLTGSKYGCGEGRCGACTVLLDGKPIRSCVTEVGKVEDAEITTLEGLEQDGKLHPLQQAFLDADALQCGYCTSGMILSGVAFLRENPEPTRERIVRFMNGNVCRCGVYSRIIEAIQKAASPVKEAAR